MIHCKTKFIWFNYETKAMWIPFCQFTVHMLYVLLSLLHCKLASIVSQIWIATQMDDALKLLQSKFQHKWWCTEVAAISIPTQTQMMMHWSLRQRSGFQHKQWWMHSSSCSTDLDSNTKCDGCTSSSLQQRSGFQHEKWWMHSSSCSTDLDSNTKGDGCTRSSCSKDLDSCTKGDRCTAQVAEKIWIAIPGWWTEVYCLLL